MVAGATDVHFVEAVPALGATLHDDCALTSSAGGGPPLAACTLVLASGGGVRTVGVKTESVGALAVQVADGPVAEASGTELGQSVFGQASGTAGGEGPRATGLHASQENGAMHARARSGVSTLAVFGAVGLGLAFASVF